jgi:predicted DNA-binding transcriptional regulator AlpA
MSAADWPGIYRKAQPNYLKITDANLNNLLKAKDVAQILCCSQALIYKMAERGQLPCVRWECPGNGTKAKMMLRFEASAVQAFIKDHRKESKNGHRD